MRTKGARAALVAALTFGLGLSVVTGEAPARPEAAPAHAAQAATTPDPSDLPPDGADADGDGVDDAVDGCDDVADPGQDDLDGDATGSACDPDELGLAAGPCANAASGATGTPVGDSFTGGTAADALSGLAGNDCMRGLDGDDQLDGGRGNDELDGGSGRDRLLGGRGADEILGGSGGDVVIGGPGRDKIDSGSEDDIVRARDGENDAISCGSGEDTVEADANDTVDASCERVTRRPVRTLTVTTSGPSSGRATGPGIDCGGTGHTDCTQVLADATAPVLRGEPGPGAVLRWSGGGCVTGPCTLLMNQDLTVDARFAPPATRIQDSGPLAHLICPILRQIYVAFLGYVAAPAAHAAQLDISAILRGVLDAMLQAFGCAPPYAPEAAGHVASARSAALPVLPALPEPDDVKLGTNRRDRLVGRTAPDLQAGRGGDDTLIGRGGSDVLGGGPGADRIFGGPGADLINGGAGRDRLHGGPGDDAVVGGPGADRIFGGPGSDAINTRDRSRDMVDCGAGRDTARVDRRDVVRRCEKVKRTRR